MDVLWSLSKIRTPFGDQLFQLITYLGQELFVIAAICLFYWCVNKRLAYQLSFTFFTAGLCVQTLKISFRVSRPWILDPAFKPVASAVPAATGYSFPSGHTQGATALFATLALAARKTWLKILLIGIFLAVGFSRMYLGVHTPKDVLSAMTISLLFAWLMQRCTPLLLDTAAHVKLVSLILAGVSAAIAVYGLTLLQTGAIETKYAMDCCKSAGCGLGFAVGFYLERTYLNFRTNTRTFAGQCIKYVGGLAATLLLKIGLSALLGPSIGAKMAEYFILLIWVLFMYPFLFSKMSLHENH